MGRSIPPRAIESSVVAAPQEPLRPPELRLLFLVIYSATQRALESIILHPSGSYTVCGFWTQMRDERVAGLATGEQTGDWSAAATLFELARNQDVAEVIYLGTRTTQS